MRNVVGLRMRLEYLIDSQTNEHGKPILIFNDNTLSIQITTLTNPEELSDESNAEIIRCENAEQYEFLKTCYEK